jgi:thioredoxin 1
MKNIKTEEFEKEVLKSDKTVLVKFYADWCGPCKALTPVVEEVEEEMKDKLKVVEVNVDEAGELAQQYGIRGIPTMIFFKEGDVKSVLVGNQPKDEIIKKVKEA